MQVEQLLHTRVNLQLCIYIYIYIYVVYLSFTEPNLMELYVLYMSETIDYSYQMMEKKII